MATKRRKLTRQEELLRAVVECSRVLSRAYRHHAVQLSDLQTVLGVLHSLHVERGEGVRLVIDRAMV